MEVIGQEEFQCMKPGDTDVCRILTSISFFSPWTYVSYRAVAGLRSTIGHQ